MYILFKLYFKTNFSYFTEGLNERQLPEMKQDRLALKK